MGTAQHLFEPTPLWLDLTAVAVGALFGAALSSRREVSLIGMLVAAVAMGLGGGILRDILLNVRPAAIQHGSYLITAACAGLVGGAVAGRLLRTSPPLMLLDGLTLGLFVVIGAEKGINAHLPYVSVVLLAVLTGVGGGVIVDVLSGERPELMRHGPWYASAALVCAVWFVVVQSFFPALVTESTTVVLAAVIRYLSVRRGWDAPTAHDLRTAARAPVRAAARLRPDPGAPEDPADGPTGT